jgi:tetratricopeptide (TPR) repeat protein
MRLGLLSFLLLATMVDMPAWAQMLPVNTTSEEAREDFELGREAAFHRNGVQAHQHPDAAIAADSAFVLAYVHRAGTSRPDERRQDFARVATNLERVTRAERHMVDAFQGEHATAEQSFRHYLQLASDQPQAYRSLGELYRSLGRHAEAAAYYEQVLERDPDSFAGWIRPGWMRDVLAWTSVEAGFYDEAETVLRENIRLHSDVAHNHDSLGRLNLQLGRHDNGATQFAAALELDPGLSASRENLELARGALSGTGADRPSVQERHLLPITTHSEEAREHFLLGRDAAHHYQFAEAREHLDRAIAADPSFVLAHLHRGGSAAYFSELQDYLGRAEANRDGVSAGEQLMIDAFRAFLLEGDYDRAIEIFSRLSSEYRDDPYLPAYLGFRYYRNLRRYDEAAEQFRRALERDSSFVQAYNWLGYIAMDRGDHATAEDNFQRYIQLAPDAPRPHDSLGVLRLRQGRYEEAVRQFEQAFVVDPRFTESRDNLVRARIEQANERFEEAFRRQDAAAIATLYTASGQLLPVGSGLLEGAQAIERFWQGIFDSGLTRADVETVEVFAGADGETATEVGRYRLAAGGQEADVGKYVVVWLRTTESWKLHRHIWTTDRAANE